MRYLSLLRDSVRESLDHKSFIITVIFSLILILACLCTGFETIPMGETLDHLFKQFSRHWGGTEVRYRVSDTKGLGKEPGREEFEGGWSFQLEAEPMDPFHKNVLLNNFFIKNRPSAKVDWRTIQIPGLTPDRKTVVTPPSEAEMAAYVETLLLNFQGVKVKSVVESLDARHVTLRVWFKPKWEHLFYRGHRISLLFGAWTLDRWDATVRDSVYFIQDILAGYLVGWVGILVAIVVTSGFVPHMLQKGMIDLVLTRPVKRWSVFLLKYLGGLTYVLVSVTILIGGCWLALGLRSGIWSPWFLLSIPLLLFFFAALYAVSTFIGLTKRNPTEAVLVSVLAWFALLALGPIHRWMSDPGSGVSASGIVMKTVDVLHAALPPIHEIDKAMSLCMLKANGITPEIYKLNTHRLGPYPEVNLARLFGVTGAWMIGLLGLSCWMFSRRDY